MWEIAAVYKQFQAITKQVIEYHIEKKEMRAQVCLSVVDLLLVAFLVGSVVLLRVPFLAIAFRHYQLAEPNPIEQLQHNRGNTLGTNHLAPSGTFLFLVIYNWRNCKHF